MDTVRTTISYALGVDLENLIAEGSAGIALTGNAFNNMITGNAGANKLYGDAGDDILSGNGGNDMLFGGFGNDVLAGGTGKDGRGQQEAVTKKALDAPVAMETHGQVSAADGKA